MELAQAIARGTGKLVDEEKVRAAERAAVLNVVRRHVHSSHFMRIEAAVNSDAKTRASTTKAAA
jgi:hypothetical protein